MTKPPPDEDSDKRIVAVTLDEESIGRSGPDIEHERAIAIYDLIEQNLFAPEGATGGPFTLHLAITGNRLAFDIRREDGTRRRARIRVDVLSDDQRATAPLTIDLRPGKRGELVARAGVRHGGGRRGRCYWGRRI